MKVGEMENERIKRKSITSRPSDIIIFLFFGHSMNIINLFFDASSGKTLKDPSNY